MGVLDVRRRVKQILGLLPYSAGEEAFAVAITGRVRLFLFFKLEEENTTLLLHLPKLVAESAVFELASGLGCILVVAIAQAV